MSDGIKRPVKVVDTNGVTKWLVDATNVYLAEGGAGIVAIAAALNATPAPTTDALPTDAEMAAMADRARTRTFEERYPGVAGAVDVANLRERFLAAYDDPSFDRGPMQVRIDAGIRAVLAAAGIEVRG